MLDWYATHLLFRRAGRDEARGWVNVGMGWAYGDGCRRMGGDGWVGRGGDGGCRLWRDAGADCGGMRAPSHLHYSSPPTPICPMSTH